jgi:hypothetical protein
LRAIRSLTTVRLMIGGHCFLKKRERRGGNGACQRIVYILSFTLLTKQLELICELVPTVATVAFLANPNNSNTAGRTRETQEIARAVGRRLQVVTAATEAELELAVLAVQGHADALMVPPDPFFTSRRNNSSRWRHGMQFLRAIHFVNTPRLTA